METISQATSVLLARLPVQRLNEIAQAGRFEAPVSGGDLMFAPYDLPAIESGVCVSCEADTVESSAGLSRCCGSQVAHPGPENDDRRDR